MNKNDEGSFLVTVIIYMLGVCTMLPWNFFITANSFWQYKLRNTSLEEWDSPDAPLTEMQLTFTPAIVILSNGICFLFSFFTSLITKRIQEKERVLGSFAVMLASMVIISAFSIIDTDSFQFAFFLTILVMVSLMNMGIAVLQASLYGMIGFFPSKYITALVSGQSLAGVVSSLAQIISLAMGDEDPATSGVIYFFIADACLILSTVAYVVLRKTVLYKISKEKLKENEKESKLVTLKDYKTVFKKVFWMGFTMGFVLLVTLSVFPAVQVYVTSTHSPSLWADVYFEPTITFLLFNVMDMAGREIPRWLQWPGPEGFLFHLVSACRIFFIPLILLCNGGNKSFPTLFHEDFYYIVINTLFALTNGYFGALCMVYYPRIVENNETELAGTIMASLMGVGLVTGSCLSPAFVALWGPEN